ncbi:MAG: aspartate kinase [Bacteroidales bacterium]|nr:aspartate kinase [Bacteroidales bacterium]MBN2821489.1 aspartate kinase [Bacteroidales bacterium]
MLTVEKIGGTSMTQFQDVLNNIIIGKSGNVRYNRIFVVSAYGGVTNWLLEHKKTGEPGVYEKFVNGDDYLAALESVLEKLIELNKSFIDIKLDQKVANDFITERIEQAKSYLNNLKNVLATGYVSRLNIFLAAREILASIGEAHSGFNSVNILENNGISAKFIDLCGFNDSDYLTIDERISQTFKTIDPSNTLAIATGYTKGTEGIMREFDRGYSEVTFSKIAVTLKADEAVIHKEFHLSSADPNLVGIDNSIPVGQTNYNVADQLADIGMEAIHPKASKPLEMAGINIRIKNTFEPEHPGTLISKTYVDTNANVEIISGSDKLVALEIHDPSMVGEVGFDLKIMEVFKKYNISYILKATNANSITQVVWEKDLNDLLLSELKNAFFEVTYKKVAIVCALGSNIAHPGIMTKAVKALADNNINIEAVSQSLKQVNMQFVINRTDYKKAIIELNKALCVK